MRSGAQHYQAIATGRRSKIAGEHWEKVIEASCQFYSQKGIAEIEKTPEPMKLLSGRNSKGQFLACFTKQAQPDYKGTLAGGRAIVFEAKHTDCDRLLRTAISEEQEKSLNRHLELGAACYVMVSFRFTHFFRIPWVVFREMKDHFGRKYITPSDVPEYEIKVAGGVLHFLRGTGQCLRNDPETKLCTDGKIEP